jgi:hypothetical protein
VTESKEITKDVLKEKIGESFRKTIKGEVEKHDELKKASKLLENKVNRSLNDKSLDNNNNKNMLLDLCKVSAPALLCIIGGPIGPILALVFIIAFKSIGKDQQDEGEIQKEQNAAVEKALEGMDNAKNGYRSYIKGYEEDKEKTNIGEALKDIANQNQAALTENVKDLEKTKWQLEQETQKKLEKSDKKEENSEQKNQNQVADLGGGGAQVMEQNNQNQNVTIDEQSELEKISKTIKENNNITTPTTPLQDSQQKEEQQKKQQKGNTK